MDKPWGGRFTKATKTEVEDFTASIFFDYVLFEEDILGSLAHTHMLESVGILNASESQDIQKALNQILERFSQGKITFSAADEDVHMKVETELKQLIGPLAGKLHTARSRNDQVSLDLHLYLRRKLVDLVGFLKNLQQTLMQKAQDYIDVVMPGYTHLQRAQPILFSHHLLAYVAMFQRDIERLQNSWPRVNQLPLGACALAGTGLPIDRELVAKILNFDSLYENSIDAVSDRDFCVEFLANSALIAMHLSRFSEELILWCSQEFAFIELDDSYCTGSSIMPQKKNPDIPELVRGKTGRIYGSLMATLTMLKGLPLAYNKDMQEDKEVLFDTVKTLETCLCIFKGLIETMRIQSDNMLKAAKKGFLNATDLADYLVLKEVPFREAHCIVGKIVGYCIEKDQNLEALSLEEMKNFSPLFSTDVFDVLDLKRIVNAKNSQGGTSKFQVEKQIAAISLSLTKTGSWIAEKKQLILPQPIENLS
jgi:argininosuccinate lyase